MLLTAVSPPRDHGIALCPGASQRGRGCINYQFVRQHECVGGGPKEVKDKP